MTVVFDSAVSQLDDLLDRVCGSLEISPTHYKEAKQHYGAVTDWLAKDESPLAEGDPQIYPQGSLRIGTTVRPRGHDEYDLDLVLELQFEREAVDNPVTLLDDTEGWLREHGVYADLVDEPLNRCVRLSFAGAFHMDILPAIPCPDDGEHCLLVPDRRAAARAGDAGWKPSNPKGYATWFLDQAVRGYDTSVKAAVEPLPSYLSNEVKSPLQRVVQLLKRWRDIRFEHAPELAPISIVLTTLAGNAFTGERSLTLATTAILDRIVTALDDVPTGDRIYVINPSNPKEDLSERWDQNVEAFREFDRSMRELRDEWHDLLGRRGVDQHSALAELLGERAVKSALVEQGKALAGARAVGGVSVERGTGALTTVTGSSVVPVPRHTFHGS